MFPEFVLNTTLGVAALSTLSLTTVAVFKRSGKLFLAAALVTVVTAGFAAGSFILS